MKLKGRNVSNITRIKLSRTSRFRSIIPHSKDVIHDFIRDNNIDSIPMYIVYSYDKSRKSQGFIVRCPKYPSRKFMSKKQSLLTKFISAKKHLETLNGCRSFENTISQKA